MANVIIFNGTEFKSATAVKTAVRETLFNDMVEFFSTKYGAERVSVVGNNEIAVAVGDVVDSDGFTQEVCGTVKPTCKDWETRHATTKTFEKFDRLTEADIYAQSVEDKIASKKEKEKAKAEKIARDKAERARKAQEKADALANS